MRQLVMYIMAPIPSGGNTSLGSRYFGVVASQTLFPPKK
jgi:hypothetical protein